ncbi:MAG: hypothetical protein IT353_10515 [Gemmatimonadaceae bacterium]|nr:hypothetical protein [Gemmatimonadaceae bacterium]
MISWWLPVDGQWLSENYAANRGKEIAHHFHTVNYDALRGQMTLDHRAHLFSGLDQLSVAERHAVADVWDQIAAAQPRVRLLNNPRRVRTRFVLLEALHAAGLNHFRVFRAKDADQVSRFPVFVRSDRRHDGPLTGLITSSRALHRAIWSLRARSESLDDLMIVEYVDARDHDGLFRKYATFRVGDRIIPSHVLAHRHWMVKAEGGERSVRIVEAEEQFQREGRFDAWARQVFDVAGIDYGRLDFGVVNGDTPQAWEINMHPTIGRGRGQSAPRANDEASQRLERVRADFHQRLRDAFVAIDALTDGSHQTPEPLVVRLSPNRLAEVERAGRRRARRQRWRALLLGVYESPLLRRPLRAVARLIVPRA